MSRDDPHFRLRLPADLKVQIENSALTNRRSITGEIVARLEASLSRSDMASIVKAAVREALEERNAS